MIAPDFCFCIWGNTALLVQECAVQMDGQHLFPVGIGKIFHRIDDLNARIGHQHIDRAPFFHDLRYACINLILAGDIHGDADGLSGAGRVQFGGSLVGGVKVEVGKRDQRAFGHITLGDAQTNAAGRASDDANLLVECHCRLTPLVISSWRVTGRGQASDSQT
jgi:hypothetical protein